MSFLRFSSNVTPRIFLVTPGLLPRLPDLVWYGTASIQYRKRERNERVTGAWNGQEGRARRTFLVSGPGRVLEGHGRGCRSQHLEPGGRPAVGLRRAAPDIDGR